MTNIAINGFLGRMGQSIFHESLNHKDIEITVGCDASGKIKSCKNEWCKIESETHKIKGYTMRKHIWGAIVSETN